MVAEPVGQPQPFCLPLPCRVPDWAADRHNPIQETRCAAVEKAVMVRPISAMITMASYKLTPGILASR